jgi:Cof subfamily protein (haloacid dehalogenase superfamily)
MTAIRLVVSDLDGTLIRSDKSLSDGNVAAVRRLINAGVGFGLISARPPSGMLWIAERLDLAGPFGAFNGGTLFDRAGTILAAHRIDPDLAHAVLAILVDEGVIRWLFADGDWVTDRTDDIHTPREIKSAGKDPIVTQALGDRCLRVDKLVAVSDDDALLSRVEARVRAIAGDRATIARSQPYYLDITAPLANKGDGLALLAEAAGVPLTQVAVLGDADNDLPMFARAGFSVAMGQAAGHVRAAASAVAQGNDEDGVADAIDRLLRPRTRTA